MSLLDLGLIRLAPQPNADKDNPACDGNTNTSDPWVCCADDETPGPLIVGKVSDSDGILLKDVCEERTLVVDEEVENSVLVREGESGAVGGAVGGLGSRLKGQTVEGRKHAEFELDRVAGSRSVGCKVVKFILGQLDRVVLGRSVDGQSVRRVIVNIPRRS